MKGVRAHIEIRKVWRKEKVMTTPDLQREVYFTYATLD